jgi:hypothetical protein
MNQLMQLGRLFDGRYLTVSVFFSELVPVPDGCVDLAGFDFVE